LFEENQKLLTIDYIAPLIFDQLIEQVCLVKKTKAAQSKSMLFEKYLHFHHFLQALVILTCIAEMTC